MRRVLVLNHFAGHPGAPSGTRHVEMFSRLHGWSYLIVVGKHASVGPSDKASSPGFLVVPTLPYSGNGLDRVVNWASYAAAGVSRLALGRSPDVVYASSPHLLAGLAGWVLARRWRVPFVLEVRDLWPRILLDMGQLDESSTVYRSLEALEAFLYSQADRIVVMAEGTVGHLLERGVLPERICFIPNAADPDDFGVVEARDQLRVKYGFSRLTCVYTGAHGPANGLDLLLDAARDLQQEHVDIVLIGDGPAKATLQRRAAEMQLTNVTFLDPIPKAEIPALLSAADIGLHVLADVALFRYGVSPNKVFDYLAAGLPMITNVPGEVGDLVERSQGGIAVEPSGLANGIRALASKSAEERRNMGLDGQHFMAEHQSRTVMARRLQELLDSLV